MCSRIRGLLGSTPFRVKGRAAASYLTASLTFLYAIGHSPKFGSSAVPIGSPCTYSFECPSNAFCHADQCRRIDCEINDDCGKAELCFFGKVATADFRNACYPFQDHKFTNVDWCPGGGRPVKTGTGHFETCDLDAVCSLSGVCNPIYGICCSKVRSCPDPARPLVDAATTKPIVCQLRGGPLLECPDEATCETKSGFCCTDDLDGSSDQSIVGEFLGVGGEVGLPPAPWPSPTTVGESCEPSRGGCNSAAGEVCLCSSLIKHGFDGANATITSVALRDAAPRRGDSDGGVPSCRCHCAAELGYSLDPMDGRTCRRARRRLKEKCEWDVECQAAYSECTSNGCRCKRGFRRDHKGGCRPAVHHCVSEAEPLKHNGRVVECVEERWETAKDTTHGDGTKRRRRGSKSAELRKVCPANYYCVPLHTHPRLPELYRGFCCPVPHPQRPQCPVGFPHESSKWPGYGCAQCPWDHHCHLDGVVTQVEICCPKACINPEDVFADGQCFPTLRFGEKCTVPEQCISINNTGGDPDGTMRRSRASGGRSSELDCREGICQCPSGTTPQGVKCLALQQCSVGNGGPPVLDSEGKLMSCRASKQCAEGHTCDPELKLCCKGSSHCPRGYVETGKECGRSGEEEICILRRKSDERICCQLEAYP